MAETLADLYREVGLNFRSAAVGLAEQTPYTPSTPLRRPTRPLPRQGDYARERQYRIEGARDRLLRGPDRLGAVGELAADLTGAPALVQHMRARMAGDRQSAVTEGLTGLAQASGFVGLPGRGMSGALAQEWRPAVSARTYRGMDQPFDPDRVAPRGPYGYGRDTSEWSAADPAVANGYAEGRHGANVESLRTEMARPLRVDAGGALYTDLPRQAIPDRGIQRRLARGAVDTEALAAAARRSGRYDGVVLENVRDPRHMNEPGAGDKPTTVYATLYPRMSRPEFGPRPVEFDPGQPDLFDPARRPLLGAARAPAAGAPQTLRAYHGSPNGVEGDFRPYTHFTTDPAYASRQASAGQPARGAVYPVDLPIQNPYIIERDFQPGALITSHDVEAGNVAAFQRLEAAGYDGVIDVINNQVVPFRSVPSHLPRNIMPQTRASDGTILPAQPRETFGRPFRRTEANSADLAEAAVQFSGLDRDFVSRLEQRILNLRNQSTPRARTELRDLEDVLARIYEGKTPIGRGRLATEPMRAQRDWERLAPELSPEQRRQLLERQAVQVRDNRDPR